MTGRPPAARPGTPYAALSDADKLRVWQEYTPQTPDMHRVRRAAIRRFSRAART